MTITPERIAELRKFSQFRAIPDHCSRCKAWMALPDLLAYLEEERVENGRLTTEMNRLRLRFPEIVIEEALGLEEPSHE